VPVLNEAGRSFHRGEGFVVRFAGRIESHHGALINGRHHEQISVRAWKSWGVGRHCASP
jgi:hypothetical protein